ncbi:MAG TPA: hypothetical protein PKC67_02235 [Kiritimatiellia bacterium]|nr:hypothetical protein [Kiritimatiellia bacterium]HMP33143.1 hypothetical protein [Kiritimatiellia bacterium]
MKTGPGAARSLLLVAGVMAFLPAVQAEMTAAAEPRVASNRWPTVTSHQRNFLVADMPKRDAVEIAVWAESVRERFMGWVGSPLPHGRAYPVVITASLRAEEPGGRVLRALDRASDGSLRQELTMVNPADMDQEDVLEALSWLLAHRWVVVRMAERSRNVPVLPDWLTVGIAQNLYPELRVRNYGEVVAMEQAGSYHPAATVFDMRFLPPGRWPEKARAGLVVAWLSETIGPERLLASCAERVVVGLPVDVAFIQELAGLPDPRSVNMAWDVWMARQDRRFMPGVQATDPEAIARVVALPAEMFGLELPASFGRRTLDAELLIQHRASLWVQRYAKAVAWRLRQEGIGQPPEIVERIRAYLVFFDALAAPGETRHRGKPVQPRSARWLERTWAEADTAWRTYLAEYQARSALLQRHEVAAEGGALDALLDRWEEPPPVAP